MTLYIMRHGETDMNRLGRMQGQCPTSLNEEGRRQSREAGAFIREQGITFDRIYSSPLPRALETCEIVTGLSRDEFLTDPRILEMDYGPYDLRVIKELLPVMLSFFKDPEQTEAPEGVESGLALRKRVADFLRELEGSCTDENVLIVSHTIAIHSMVLVLLNKAWNESDRQYYPGNCEVFEVTGFGTGGGIRIRSLTRGDLTFPEQVE